MGKKFFSLEEERRIINEIRSAEKKTSGEIRLHVESRCWRAPIKRAALVFLKLKMHKTQLRNGVLIYIAFKKQKFAIVGDKGIHEEVGTDFWVDIKEEMYTYFQKKKICDGICVGINRIGEKLKKYFPYSENDVNELPDNISYGD